MTIHGEMLKLAAARIVKLAQKERPEQRLIGALAAIAPGIPLPILAGLAPALAGITGTGVSMMPRTYRSGPLVYGSGGYGGNIEGKVGDSLRTEYVNPLQYWSNHDSPWGSGRSTSGEYRVLHTPTAHMPKKPMNTSLPPKITFGGMPWGGEPKPGSPITRYTPGDPGVMTKRADLISNLVESLGRAKSNVRDKEYWADKFWGGPGGKMGRTGELGTLAALALLLGAATIPVENTSSSDWLFGDTKQSRTPLDIMTGRVGRSTSNGEHITRVMGK